MEQSQPDIAADDPIECYSCGTPLPEGRRHCPGCGRSQLRTCYCGEDIPVTLMTCPHCAADWTQSARVRRRKSRSRQVRWVNLAGYALGGAAVALIIAAVLNMAIALLARGAVPPGEALPLAGGDRLVLAAQTIAGAFTRVWGFLTAHRTSLIGFLLVLLAGAVAGAAYYYFIGGGGRGGHSVRNSTKSRDGVRVRRRRS